MAKHEKSLGPDRNVAPFAAGACAYHLNVVPKCHRLRKLFSWNDFASGCSSRAENRCGPVGERHRSAPTSAGPLCVKVSMFHCSTEH